MWELTVKVTTTIAAMAWLCGGAAILQCNVKARSAWLSELAAVDQRLVRWRGAWTST